MPEVLSFTLVAQWCVKDRVRDACWNVHMQHHGEVIPAIPSGQERQAELAQGPYRKALPELDD